VASRCIRRHAILVGLQLDRLLACAGWRGAGRQADFEGELRGGSVRIDGILRQVEKTKDAAGDKRNTDHHQAEPTGNGAETLMPALAQDQYRAKHQAQQAADRPADKDDEISRGAPSKLEIPSTGAKMAAAVKPKNAPIAAPTMAPSSAST
jgi:hypothetical protein